MPRLRHLSRELLLAARRGEITDRELAERLLQLLTESCPTCREEAAQADAGEIPLAAYGELVSRALHTALHHYGDEAEAALDLLETLRPLSPEQRLLRIRNSPDRFANRVLGEKIVAEARACLPDDPKGSLAWARALQAIAHAYPVPYSSHQVLALAFQGNAWRALGDFARARRLLTRARRVQQQDPDVEIHAELHSFFGSLYIDLRRLDEAAQELEQAAEVFRALRDDFRLAGVLMQLGTLHGHRDDLPAALRADRQALALLAPDEHRSLYLSARLNYAFHLQMSGRIEEAQDQADSEYPASLEEADEHTRIRFEYLQARLAADFGKPAVAEGRFLRVLDEFVRQRHGFNAAIVCLELAVLYYTEGRLDEVHNVAGQALELFQAYETHREAQAALRLVRDAALSRTLTTEALRRVASFLRDARADPTARFQLAH
ncbi:MAG: hypothetical protein ACOC7L_01825 [Acidobacteriota bacterium]